MKRVEVLGVCGTFSSKFPLYLTIPRFIYHSTEINVNICILNINFEYTHTCCMRIGVCFIVSSHQTLSFPTFNERK